MKKYIAELIGTFALVFAGTGAMVINDVTGGVVGHLGIAFSFGMVVTAMIYAVGDVSGAHINPAVTIGFWVAKRLDGKRVMPYILFQVLGAVLASVVLKLLFPGHAEAGMTLPSGTWVQTFVLEVILTFFLMFVILNVSTGSKEKGIMAGAAIGITVGLEALFAGPISGASMNPARSLAPALAAWNFQYLWVYIVATTFGAVLAVYGCKVIQPKGCCETKC